jgi:hypothetical protein
VSTHPVERRGVLVCHCIDRNGNPASPEWTYWRDLAEARQARDALSPCGSRCGGVHTCIEVDVPPRRAEGPRRASRTPTQEIA